MNVELFRVWHPHPIKSKVSTWFCKFHPKNLLTVRTTGDTGPIKSICEQCLNLFIQAGRRKSEHTSNERSVRRRHWS